VNDALVVETADVRSAEVGALLAAYFAEIRAAFGFDPAHVSASEPEEFDAPRGRFLLARTGETPAGCAGVRLLDPQTAEIKRMWVNPALRGRGVGRTLLGALESAAIELGARRGVLDTNGALSGALALYRSAGWTEVPAYNDNPDATHWFAKNLDRS